MYIKYVFILNIIFLSACLHSAEILLQTNPDLTTIHCQVKRVYVPMSLFGPPLLKNSPKKDQLQIGSFKEEIGQLQYFRSFYIISNQDKSVISIFDNNEQELLSVEISAVNKNNMHNRIAHIVSIQKVLESSYSVYFQKLFDRFYTLFTGTKKSVVMKSDWIDKKVTESFNTADSSYSFMTHDNTLYKELYNFLVQLVKTTIEDEKKNITCKVDIPLPKERMVVVKKEDSTTDMVTTFVEEEDPDTHMLLVKKNDQTIEITYLSTPIFIHESTITKMPKSESITLNFLKNELTLSSPQHQNIKVENILKNSTRKTQYEKLINNVLPSLQAPVISSANKTTIYPWTVVNNNKASKALFNFIVEITKNELQKHHRYIKML